MPDSTPPQRHASGQEAAAVEHSGDPALFNTAEPASAVSRNKTVGRLAQRPGEDSPERAEEGPSPPNLTQEEQDRIAPQVQPGTIGQNQ